MPPKRVPTFNKDLFDDVLSSLIKGGVTSLDGSNIVMSDDHLETIISAAENTSCQLTSISLSNNHITSVSAQRLASFIKTHNVKTVNLANNKIDDEGMKSFLPLFDADEFPTMFNVRQNPCADFLMQRLSNMARYGTRSPSMKRALLYGNEECVSLEGIEYNELDEALINLLFIKVGGIKCISFAGCAVGDTGLGNLGEVIKESKVEELDFTRCNISNNGLLNFFEVASLATHPTLKRLTFNGNISITNVTAVEIIPRVFDTNTSIVECKFEDTSMTTDFRRLVDEECQINRLPLELKSAVVALRRNKPESRRIELQWIPSMSTCMTFLWRCVRDSAIIDELNLCNAGINDEAMELLGRALNRNKSLRVLQLANNNFTVEGLTSLMKPIQRGVSPVKELNLANNDLDDSAIDLIVAALRSNLNITHVILENNPRIKMENIFEVCGYLAVNQAPSKVRTMLPLLERNDEKLTEIDFSESDIILTDSSLRLICQAMASNTRVTRMNLANNNVTDIGAGYLAQLLASNRSIKEVILCSNAVCTNGLLALCSALETNDTLCSLDAYDNVFDSSAVDPFFPMLRRNYTLQSVRLEHTRAPSAACRAITHACGVNMEDRLVKDEYYRLVDKDASATELVLTGDVCKVALTDRAVELLVSVLLDENSVTTINFANNQIGAAGCGHLATYMKTTTCVLTTLDLHGNRSIDDEAIGLLCEGIVANQSLTTLDLTDTGITEEGCAKLSQALRVNNVLRAIAISDSTTGQAVDYMRLLIGLNIESLRLKQYMLRIEGGEVLKEIDLSEQLESPFSDEACELMCLILSGYEHMTTLLLSSNHITSRSTRGIADLVESCPSLSFIDLSRNFIDNMGANELIELLERVSHVRTLMLLDNPISVDNMERVAQLLTLNMRSLKLKEIMLRQARGELLDEVIDFNGEHTNYRLEDNEIKLLAQILRGVTEVRVVDLGCNSIGDEGCIALGDMLRVNFSLSELYLNDNFFGQDGGDALFHALRINPNLSTVDLTNTNVPAETLEDILYLLHINQTPLRERVDMRSLKLVDVNDETQFHNTNYHLSQTDNINEQALDYCKQTQILNIK